MSKLNMSRSFMEENVPLAFTQPSEFVEDVQKTLLSELEFKKQTYDSTIKDHNDYLNLNEEKLSQMKKQLQRLNDRKNELSSALFEIGQLLCELSLKKKSLEETVIEPIAQEELNEILQRVVEVEKENKMKIDEIMKTKRNLVGQMCFYKEYLDVYIDKLGEGDYIMYFRRYKKGQDEKKPNEWIRINTLDFKNYKFIDISLPEGSKERNEILELYESGISLRQLIWKARKACLS